MHPTGIIICHSAPQIGKRLSARVNRLQINARIFLTNNLTDAYDRAEHETTDSVFVSADLATRPNFELLYSLMSILKIKCSIITDFDQANGPAFAKNINTLSIDAHDDLLLAAMTANDKQHNKPTRQQISTSIGRPFSSQSTILIGASTGGVDALATVFGHFSEQTPPVLAVQHTGGQFSRSLIRHLDSVTKAKVCAAHNGQPLQAGHIYLAPSDDMHLCLDSKNTRKINLISEGPLSGHRPSIDALFRSAKPVAQHIAAAILTGMGRDGARGLKLLRDAGAQTIGQDAATSVVYGMPRVAHELGAVEQQLPLYKIGPALLAACTAKARV